MAVLSCGVHTCEVCSSVKQGYVWKSPEQKMCQPFHLVEIVVPEKNEQQHVQIVAIWSLNWEKRRNGCVVDVTRMTTSLDAWEWVDTRINHSNQCNYVKTFNIMVHAPNRLLHRQCHLSRYSKWPPRQAMQNSTRRQKLSRNRT